MLRRLLLICFVGVGGQLMAQASVSGGASLFNNFGIGTNYYGFDIGGEYSDSDEQSYWGRISIYPGKKNRNADSTYLESYDPTQNYYSLGYQTKTSYAQLSGGSRYYLGDGYTYGLSVYGGYKFSLIFGTVKFDFDDYNTEKYKEPTDIPRKSQMLLLSMGFNGGVKYSFSTVGTVFFETNIDYALVGSFSNSAFQNSDYFSGNRLYFSLNLGFRKDLNWY